MMSTLIAVHSDELNELKQEIKDLKNLCSTLIEHTKNNIVKPFYTNKDLPELLGVGQNWIKKYRDEGYLPYTQVGDKFLYSYEDIMYFYQKNRLEAYAYD